MKCSRCDKPISAQQARELRRSIDKDGRIVKTSSRHMNATDCKEKA